MFHIPAILKCIIVTGLFIILEFVPISDLGATVYTCRDRVGQTVFTDSPAQLQNCQVFSFPLSLPNGMEQADQEQLSAARVPVQNSDPAFSRIPPNLELTRNVESESIPIPTALHANESPASSPFSTLAPGELLPGLEDLLAPGLMPPPEMFEEGNVPQGLPSDNNVSPYAESQRALTETEFGRPGFSISPNVEAPNLSEVPYAIFSNLAAVPPQE